MSSEVQPSEDRTPPVVTAERVLAGLSLLVPIVALLWVSSYSKVTPEMGGVPFFYWYQILWIPASALFTGAAYLLLNRDAKQRKDALVLAQADPKAGERP